MEYFPIFVDLRDKKVLVIGDYRVLEFKIKKMTEAGAKILYLTDLRPEQIEDIDNLKNVQLIHDQFNEDYLKDIWLVVCGSEEVKLKNRIFEAAKRRNIFTNFVDEAPISSFISPSVISKGDITIALSTKGKSPALNKYLKNEIINTIGDEYSKFAEILGKMRKKVIEHVPNQKKRSELFDLIIYNSKVQDLIRGKNYIKAEKLIESMIETEIKNLYKNQ